MPRAYLFQEQAPILARQWNSFKITRHRTELIATAKRLIAGKDKYLEIEHDTGVPWYVVAIIHEREAGGPPHWDRNIAQGDRWDRVSHNVPAGRGPFKSFREAAYDALVTLKGYQKHKGNWTIERILYTLQPYNGLGYFYKGIPSPYIWSCTDQYDPPHGPGGKYVSDGVFSRTAVDQQLGCAPILRVMMDLDPTIKPGTLHTPEPVKPTISTTDKLIVSGATTAVGLSFIEPVLGLITIFAFIAVVTYLAWRKHHN